MAWAEMVAHENGAAHADVQIGQGFVKGLRRGVQGDEDIPAAQEHHHGDDRAADAVQGEHGAHRFGDFLLPLRSDVLGDEHRAAHGQAADEVDDQDGHLAAQPHGGGAHGAAEPADDEHVRQIVQRLEQIGGQKGQRKQKQLLGHAALGQIVLKFAQRYPLLLYKI